MKNSAKFAILTISILLVFSITLALCISGIGSHKGADHSYDMGDTGFMSVIGGIASQGEMQKKFGVYNHVETDSESTVLRIFSEEQADNILSQRKDGKKFCLTYDEALFLINDSVRLYYEYDSIILTSAYETGILSAASSDPSKVIDCYHGDFSEFNYGSAVQTYNQMLNDINDIIRHRVAMLDSRLVPVMVRQFMFSGMYGYGFTVSLEGDDGFEDKEYLMDVCRCKQYVIAFDDGKSTEDEYKALVKSMLLSKYQPVYFPSLDKSEDTSEDKADKQVYEYPFIQFADLAAWSDENMSSGYVFMPVNLSISATNTTGQTNQVFPLQEITDMCPQWYLTPEYFNTDSITIDLILYNNINSKRSWELATITDKQIIEDIISAIGDKQAVCDTVNNKKEKVAYEYKKYDGCFFELDLNNGTSVVLPASTYFKTAANVYQSTSKISGIPKLYNCVPEEFINTVREICKPYADEYLETDEKGNYVFSTKTVAAEKYSEIDQEKKTDFYGKYEKLWELITPSMTESDYHSIPEYSDLVHTLNVDKDYCWIVLKHCYDVSDTAEQRFLLKLAAAGAGGKYTITDDLTLTESVTMIYYMLTAACE